VFLIRILVKVHVLKEHNDYILKVDIFF